MKRLLLFALLAALVLPGWAQDETRIDFANLLRPRVTGYALNLNQNLRTSDSPTFAGLTLSGGTASTLAYLNASKKFTSLANGAGYLLNDGSGGLSWAAVSLSGYLTATATSEATLGNTLIANGDFATSDLTGWTAAAGWSAATGKAVHTAGIADTTPLVQAVSVTNGSVYQVQCTTSAGTAGTLTLTLGSLTGSYSVSGNVTSYYTFTATATASVNLTFTPTDTFNGAIDDISVKLVTANATPILAVKDSTATAVGDVRGSAVLGNLFAGNGVGRYNTTGVQNAGFGYQALFSNTTGSNNSAQGYWALFSNTTGSNNSAQGAYALRANTTGSYNSAQGYGTFYSNTTGSNNSAQGAYALRANTTGSYNSAQGAYALFSNTTGSYNSAQGVQALFSNTTGSNNSAQGYQAGRYIADGATANTTSDYSTYIGADTKASVDNAQNETIIGYNAIGAGDNTVRLGNTSVTDVSSSGNYISQRIVNADSDTDEIDSVTWAGGAGLIIAYAVTDGKSAVWRLEGTTLVAVSVDVAFTATKDNAATYNVYFEGGALKLQNKVGDNKALRLGFFGI